MLSAFARRRVQAWANGGDTRRERAERSRYSLRCSSCQRIYRAYRLNELRPKPRGFVLYWISTLGIRWSRKACCTKLQR